MRILKINSKVRPEKGGIALERYFTDTVYARRSEGIPLELERKEHHYDDNFLKWHFTSVGMHEERQNRPKGK